MLTVVRGPLVDDERVLGQQIARPIPFQVVRQERDRNRLKAVHRGEIQQTPHETCAVGSKSRSHPTRVNSSHGRDRRAPDHVLLDLLGVGIGTKVGDEVVAPPEKIEGPLVVLGRGPHATGLTENSYRNSSLALFATVRVAPNLLKGLEREKGFEPSTSTLARWHSTTELLPRNEPPF